MEGTEDMEIVVRIVKGGGYVYQVVQVWTFLPESGKKVLLRKSGEEKISPVGIGNSLFWGGEEEI